MKIIPADEMDIPESIREARDSLGRRIGKRNKIFKKLYGNGYEKYMKYMETLLKDAIRKSNLIKGKN